MAKKPKAKVDQPGTPLEANTRASGSARAGGVPATPAITTPPASSYVLPNTDLLVRVSNNRGDLRYIIEFTDLTPPPQAPVVVNVPAPGARSFMVTIPGASLPANQTYQIHVSVDPLDGPPPAHLDHTINVHTNAPLDEPMIVMTAKKRKK